MIRIALILAHAALIRATRFVARAADVPPRGRVEIHVGPWCVLPDEYGSPRQRLLQATTRGMVRMPIDRVDRGKTLAVATHSWQDGGAEIYVMLNEHEVSGAGAAAIAKSYDDEQNMSTEES